MTLIQVILLIAGTSLIIYLWNHRTQRQHLNLPPGPPKDPFIGHLRHMPASQPADVFHEWAKTYGDVMHFEVLGKSIIVLDTHQAAVDLLDKRSAIYSDRPPFRLYEILGWTHAIAFLPYGKLFAKHRQVLQSYLSHQKCPNFQPTQLQEAQRLARNLLSSAPKNYDSDLNRFATSIVVRIMTGHRIISDDDPYMPLSEMVLKIFSFMGPPGGTAIDACPLLQHFPSWFPGAHYAGVAIKWRPTVRKLYDCSIELVEKQREAGETLPSFVLSHLEAMENGTSALDLEELKGAAAAFFAAGKATTSSTVIVFIFAMLLYPECQLKAQKEIDSVVGSSRLPSFEDRGKLPYLECVLQETVRWKPVAPLGIPHRSSENDVYRGMHIPKGSIVVPNVRGMSLNESVYHNPKSFYPERFLSQPLGHGEPHFSSSAFGYGRRICPGLHLADNSVWIAIATILATCNITNALDEHGNIIVPKCVMSEGLDCHPIDFEYIIRSRSPAVEALLNEDTMT